MTRKELLMAFKVGKLTTAQLQEQLHALCPPPRRHPLSEGQKGLWMLQKVTPEMSAYNIPLCFRIYQQLEIEKFKQAGSFLLQQFPILTSVFGEADDGVPYRLVQPGQSLAWRQEDISGFEAEAILPYLKQKAKEPFLLQEGPLMRLQLFSRSAQEHIVLIVVHHIIFDGSSALLLISGLLDAYHALKAGQKTELKPVSPFHEFVEWEQAMLSGTKGEIHRNYWQQQLSGTLPILELPTDRPRLAGRTSAGHTYTDVFAPEATKRIKSFAQTRQLNPAIILLGIYQILLHHYTGVEDIIVGVPTIGRPAERFDSQIGNFINMLPVRSRISNEQRFSEFIEALQFTMVDGLDHAAYPFPLIVRELNISRELTNSPVYQTAFIYQNFYRPTHCNFTRTQDPNRLRIEFEAEIHQEGEFELGLEVYDQEEQFALNLKYDTHLYNHATIKRMMGHYIKLTEEIINNPNLTLGEYSFFSPEEQMTHLGRVDQQERLPLTASGKIARKNLPEPDGEIFTDTDYAAPQSEIEKQLVAAWQEVLGVQNIGLNDNFFSLGGDSVTANQVVAKLQRFKLKLELKNLFLNPLLKDVSKYVNKIEPGITPEAIPGSSSDTMVARIGLAELDQILKEYHANL